jgi:hypothetical protein
MTPLTLVRTVARGLRYRTLDALIDLEVMVAALATVEDAVRQALRPHFPEHCFLDKPVGEGAVAKYGLLDLLFNAPEHLLGNDFRSGIALLRDLGFLPGRAEVRRDEDLQLGLECLEMLQEDLALGRTYLRLFLESDRPQGAPVFPLGIPDGYLPRPFRVVDACVTNAHSVWLLKHFYL